MGHGFVGGIREIWNLFRLIVGFFDPREIPRMLRRDTGAVIDSSKLVRDVTSSAATDVAKQAALSPRRLAIWCWHAPQRFFFFIITRSRKQLIIIALSTVTGLIVTIWPTIKVIREKRQQGLAIEQNRQLDEHFARSDIKGVTHNVDVLLKVNPNDEKMQARKKALETGKAPPTDPKIARLLMSKHLSEGKLDDAEREARTCLVVEKNDWESLLVVAWAELRRGDRAAASKTVLELPRPNEVRQGATLWSCNMGVNVFRALGNQARIEELIAFMSDAYIPLVRHESIVKQAVPAGRLQLVEIYNMCMTTLEHRPGLQRFWVPVQEICHGIANDPESTVPVLASLGVLQEIHREGLLRQMLHLKLIDQEKYEEYVAEIDNRLKTIWKRVREGDPKHHLGYLGPSMQKARAGDFQGAAKEIEAGIVACGPMPELIEKKVEIMRKLDPTGGLAFLEAALAGADIKPDMCKIIADASLSAGRPDKAMEAAKKALAMAPDLVWAIRMVAQIHLDGGRPADAVAVLNDQPIVLDDPSVGNLYVRALASAGAVAGAQEFLLRALKSPQSRPIVLSGAEALAKLGHQEAAIVVLRRLTLEEPLNGLAHYVLGETMQLLAERGTGGWHRRTVDDAIKSYRNALLGNPHNLRIVGNIAWLELAALDMPKLAVDSAKPLREAEADLPADLLATLGAVYVGNGEYDKGRAALEKAVSQGNGKASVRAYLALAYHGLNRLDLAQSHIGKAVTTAKTGPREGELVEIIRRRVERR